MILQPRAADVTHTPPHPTAPPLVVLSPGPDVRLVGVSVRARNLRVAARAGVEVADAAELAAHGDRLALLIPPGVAIEPPLFPLPACPSPACASPVSLVAPGIGDSKPAAAVLFGRASALAALAELTPPAAGSARAAAAALPHCATAAGALLDVSTASARRRAAWHILQRTGKPTDGWVSRHLNRPISRLFSFVMLSIGLRAVHGSALTLAVGLGAAAAALRPGHLAMVLTGLLFQAASIADGVDGEMARATLTESKRGARIDTIVDQLTYVACFVGLTIGWVREGGGTEAATWAFVIAAALVLSLLRGGRFVSKYAPDASFVFIDRAVGRAARESGRASLRFLSRAFMLLRRDVFCLVFMAVAITGRRALVPALVGFGVLIANLTFTIYRRELAAAALAETRSA